MPRSGSARPADAAARINGFSAMVRAENDGKLDDRSAENLRRVRAASDRMGKRIDDLLDQARLSGRSMCRQKVNPGTPTARVVASLTGAHPKLDMDVTTQPDMKISTDPV